MKKILLILLLILVAPFLFVYSSYASNGEKEKRDVILPRGQTVEGDYFAAGDTVTISGTVNGDAYVAGGTVIVEGPIKGDLIAAGGTINVRGNVAGNLRVVGGQITLSGDVGNSTSVAGGNINITDNANMSGGLAVAAGNAEIFGPVAKDANIAGGAIVIGSVIGRNLNAVSNQVTLTSGAQVTGDFTYRSDNKAKIQSGAKIAGQTKQNRPVLKAFEQRPEEVTKGAAAVFSFFKIANFILYLIIGLLIIKLLPNYTNRTLRALKNRLFVNLFVGFIAFVFFPIIFIALLVTVVGIPIAFIFLSAFIAFLYLAIVFVSLALGQKVLNLIDKNKTRVGWALLAGLIIYEILTIIPFIGWLVTLVFILVGIGAILTEERDLYYSLRKRNLI